MHFFRGKFLQCIASSMQWRTVFIIFVFLMIMSFAFFTIANDRYMHHTRWYEHQAPCRTPEREMNKMVDLAFLVATILNEFNITHSLCYGTLWGVLRTGRILPWDNNVDFCVLKEELDKVSWPNLLNAMQSHNLDVKYDNRHGEIVITDGPAVADITVFYRTYWDEVFLNGWEYRFLWFFSDDPISFPARLLEGPLPNVTFHGKGKLSIPHDDIEMQKYLYKDDWWLVRSPPGCENNN